MDSKPPTRDGSVTPDDPLHQQATAYVFGELEADAAAEFEEQLADSSELQTLVASIRETVTAIESELAETTPPIRPADRQRVEQAIHPETLVAPAPPVVTEGPQASGRRWVIALATAAALLLIGGLTLPALNHLITAQSESGDVRQQDHSSYTSEQETSDQEAIEPDQERLRDARGYTGDRASGTHRGEAMAGQGGGNQRASRQGASRQAADSTQTFRPARTRGLRSETPASAAASNAAATAEVELKTKSDRATAATQPATGAPPRPQLGVAPTGKAITEGLATEPQSGEMQTEMATKGGIMTDAAEEMGMRGGMMGQGMAAPTQRLAERSGRTRRSAPPQADAAEAGQTRLLKREASDASSFSLLPHPRPVPQPTQPDGDRFDSIRDNPFRLAAESPLSTFSIDVDTASYAKVRMNLLQHHRLPNPDAVRIEEMINYFDYDYQPPTDDQPFSAAIDVAGCPWNPAHRLARIGIQGQVVDRVRPASNLVFLLDVSGSMNQPNKLPLVKSGMRMLVNQLDQNDSVAIVVYAGAAGLVLDATPGDRKQAIYDALDRLRAGGSTNGGQGIELAYRVARDHFVDGGINRVILCSDGDFNVGVTGTQALVDLAAGHARDDVFLSVLGFGSGNHNDAMMEQISNRANGNYAFIDSEDEARKVFVDQLQGTLVTIAKDVKIQVEFNPAQVRSYRLIGYANRMLAAEDFNDDGKDAGEIGAGHAVTALYELVPAELDEPSGEAPRRSVDALKYQRQVELSEQAASGELFTLKVRYKQPTGQTSQLLEFPATDSGQGFRSADQDFQFAAAVAAFGMLLRDSEFKGQANYGLVEEIASAAEAGDRSGYREEFVTLVRKARQLAGARPTPRR